MAAVGGCALAPGNGESGEYILDGVGPGPLIGRGVIGLGRAEHSEFSSHAASGKIASGIYLAKVIRPLHLKASATLQLDEKHAMRSSSLDQQMGGGHWHVLPPHPQW